MRLCAVLVAVALLCPCASLWVPATGTPSPAWCSQHYSSAELGIFSRHWCCRTDAAWSWPGVPRPSNASFAHLLVPLRDKRLLLAGDSTTQQTFDGLQIGLLMAGVLFSVHKRPRKPVPVPQLDGYDITPYNITHGVRQSGVVCAPSVL